LFFDLICSRITSFDYYFAFILSFALFYYCFLFFVNWHSESLSVLFFFFKQKTAYEFVM